MSALAVDVLGFNEPGWKGADLRMPPGFRNQGCGLRMSAGCSHGCPYCVAADQMIRQGLTTREEWLKPKPGTPRKYQKRNGHIVTPVSSDIEPAVYDFCAGELLKLVRAGNCVLIATKPHLDCIRDLCRLLAPWRDQVMFRCTITSTDPETLRFWEPGAPLFEERLAALAHAFSEGYHTSVNIEPFLDDTVLDVLAAVKPFVTVDYWLGLANRIGHAVSVNMKRDPVYVDAAKKVRECWEKQPAKVKELLRQVLDDKQFRAHRTLRTLGL